MRFVIGDHRLLVGLPQSARRDGHHSLGGVGPPPHDDRKVRPGQNHPVRYRPLSMVYGMDGRPT